MSQPKQKNNRKVFLINPKFQISYIKHTVNIMVLVVSVFYASNLYHFWQFKQKGLAAGLPQDHIFFSFLNEQQRSMDWVFLVTAIVVAVFIIAYGLFLSHRVAGPLYRMNKHLTENRAKKASHDLKFRKGDYFPELAENFNDYVKELNK